MNRTFLIAGARTVHSNADFNFPVKRKTRRYRYTLCGNGEEELYDHEKDPNEWTNHAANPEYAGTKDELRQALVDMRNTGTNKGSVKND